MSTTALDSFPVPVRKPRSQAYPFDEWMDGKLRIARKGIDFWTTPQEFHHILRKSAAASESISVTALVCCENSSEPDAVVFQYFKPGEVCVDLRRLIIGRSSSDRRVPQGLFTGQKPTPISAINETRCTPVLAFFVPGQQFVTPPAA